MKRLLPAAAAVLSLLCLPACTEPGGQVQDPLELSVYQVLANAGAGSQFIRVSAPGEWTIDIDWGAAQAWGSLSVSSGMGNKKNIVFSWEANPGNDERQAVLTLKDKNGSVSETFSQSGKSYVPPTPTVLTPDSPGKWLELPALDQSGCYFFTREMTLGIAYRGRNYSFYLDPDARISLWVAYPLNRTLIGSGSRDDQWALDPRVPEEYQSVIYKGYKGGNYDRGHQLPSADRLSEGVNETTFYGTNITPQLSNFNQNIWARLEGMVRNWSFQFDTLYVVTGADIRGATQVAYDNYGKEITVPTGYYKVLLGYKRNGTVANTNETGGYAGVAFYFEHKNYSNTKETIFEQSLSIDAIEQKLGMDFFVNLPSVAGAEFAAKAETTVAPWWKSN